MASKAGSMVLFALLILPTPQDPTVAVLSSANQEKHRLWKIGKRYGKDTKRSGLRCLYRLLRPLSISLSLSWSTLCDLWSSKTCQGATRAGFSATPEAALGGSNSSNHEEFPWHPVAFRDMCIMWCWNWDQRRLWWPPLLERSTLEPGQLPHLFQNMPLHSRRRTCPRGPRLAVDSVEGP